MEYIIMQMKHICQDGGILSKRNELHGLTKAFFNDKRQGQNALS
jgi:hypothetical protein